jgi:sodium/proline symporter
VSAPVTADGWAVAAFLGYLALLVWIGVRSARFSSRGIGEFFVAGRSMPRFVVALSAVVSGRSAWLLLGVTGMAYVRGASAIWAVAGYTVVELFLFLFLAPRLRRFAGAHDCVTLTDVFAARFDDRDGRLRILLSAVILVFMVAYVAAQFTGGGKAMAAGFHLQPLTGILLTAAIVLGYTMVGGFLAVSLTDTVQGVFMLAMLLVLPVAAMLGLGGFGPAWQAMSAEAAMVDPFAIGAGALVGFLAIGLGSPGSPHILVRYMAIRDAAQLRWVAGVGTAWNVLMGVGAVLIGVVGRAWFPELDALPGGDPENLFPALAAAQLPPVLFGMAVAAIFAAIMSTADSQLLVAASAVVRDVYEKVLHRDRPVPQERLVRLSRGVVVLLVAAALLFGLLAQELVFWLVLFAWAGLGAALGPTVILALFWPGTTRAGAAAGIVAGALTTIVWYSVPPLRALVYELVPGFAAGLLATLLVSRLTRR